METFPPTNSSENLMPLTVQERLNDAVGHHTAGRLAEAEILYQEILKEDANQPTALHLLGVIALQTGKHERAVELISKAVAIYPDFAVAYNNLGTSLKAMGRLDEAVSNYQKALTIKPDFSDALFNLGIAYGEKKQFLEAASSYQKALNLNPNFAMAHLNLGKVLQQLGQLDAAISHYQNVITIDPNLADAYSRLGQLLQKTGNRNAAVEVYNKLLEVQPDHVDGLFNLGKLYHELGQTSTSVEYYQKGLHLNPGRADALCNLGLALQDLGNVDQALECYLQAVSIKPDLLEAHYNLGSLQQSRNQVDEAIASYQKALEINPRFVQALNNIGVLLKDVGKLDEAVIQFERAIDVDASYGAAYDNLCEVLEKTNDTDALRKWVKQAREKCTIDPRLAYREAQLLKREGDIAAARAVLEDQPDIENDYRFNAAKGQLLGDLCDRLDDPDAAFSFFEKCNNWRKMTLDPQITSAEKYLNEINKLARSFTPEWVSGWQDVDVENARPDPVFLVGFPRSGTTLLDTILRSHHAISVVEEGPSVTKMEKVAAKLLGPYPGGLTQINKEQLLEIRQVYFDDLDRQEEGELRSPIIIDKMPLNLISAGLIHRVFPHARFLFAQRHPCDCVLSCFMQDFELNHAMANFLNLQNTAQLYDKVMSLWSQYQDILPLRVHPVRYESLIEAFDDTLNPVLEFLDLEWDEGMRNYAETAKQRGLIRTPSYNQVTQPLYTRARGRWRRYQTRMEPVLSILQPWIKKFEYD